MQNLLSILLQSTVITTDTVATATNGMTKVENEMNMLSLIEKGGWVMIPIFILLFMEHTCEHNFA